MRYVQVIATLFEEIVRIHCRALVSPRSSPSWRKGWYVSLLRPMSPMTLLGLVAHVLTSSDAHLCTCGMRIDVYRLPLKGLRQKSVLDEPRWKLK